MVPFPFASPAPPWDGVNPVERGELFMDCQLPDPGEGGQFFTATWCYQVLPDPIRAISGSRQRNQRRIMARQNHIHFSQKFTKATKFLPSLSLFPSVPPGTWIPNTLLRRSGFKMSKNIGLGEPICPEGHGQSRRSARVRGRAG